MLNDNPIWSDKMLGENNNISPVITGMSFCCQHNKLRQKHEKHILLLVSLFLKQNYQSDNLATRTLWNSVKQTHRPSQTDTLQHALGGEILRTVWPDFRRTVNCMFQQLTLNLPYLSHFWATVLVSLYASTEA